MVGPDFRTPEPSLAERWTLAGDPTVVTDRRSDAAWWTSFNDPTLTALIETAYRQNLTLLAAGTRVLEARARLGVAIGELYPQSQELTGSVTSIRPSRNDQTAFPSGVTSEFWRSTLAAQATWELDFWGRFRRGVQAADAQYLASIATYDDVLVTLLADVASTYIAIRTQQAQIAIAEANVVKQRLSLRIARDRFQGGVSTALDVAQAENVLAQTESTIPQLTAQLIASRSALAVLLGQPPSTLAAELGRARPQIPLPPPTAAVGVPADLLRRRPDIRAAELRAAAQSEQVGIALAQLFPAFRLSGLLGTNASTVGTNDLGQMFNASSLSFAFGLDFSWPVLNYGQITNTVRVQDARLQALLIGYRNTVLQAQKEVETGLGGYAEGARQVALLQRSTAAAERALSLANEQYRLGTRDFTTVLTAAQNLFQAESNLASAMGARANSLVGLYRALGGGWQIREGSRFLDDGTIEEMRQRTNWGRLLPPPGAPVPATPGLPGPADRGPSIRAPEW